MDNVIQHIKIEDIVPRNHRYNLSDIKSLEDLAISIKENGIKEPLILKKTKDKYEIISGNRRYRAAILAGLTKVPALIEDYDYNKLLKNITENDDNYSKSINNNSDVVNLSELSKEYEREDFNMNNEIMNNNVQQSTSVAGNTPTFGGRFFPSLEDEPTNMAFNTTIETPQNQTQSVNSYIDLTDTNQQVAAPMTPEQPQNINYTIAPQEVQPNVVSNPEMTMDNVIMPPNNGSVLSIESLTQNSSIVQPVQAQPVTQQEMPVSQPAIEPTISNIDNNFQEVISDFQATPVSNMSMEMPMQPNITSQSMVAPVEMEQVIQPINNIEPMMNNQINIPQDIIPTPVEPQQSIENPMPENINIQPEPIIENSNNNVSNSDGSVQPVVEPIVGPEVINQMSQKDILPVINTLKAVGINLENFGYTIRITDEDLPTSYKITIEVDK